MKMTSAFGRMLRDARLRLDMSQEDVAKLAGVTGATVSRAESGAVQPSVETVERIARVLGLDVDQALLAAGYAPRNPRLLGAARAASRADGYDEPLPPEVQRAVDALIQQLKREYRNNRDGR